jgi:hypothetical protein
MSREQGVMSKDERWCQRHGTGQSREQGGGCQRRGGTVTDTRRWCQRHGSGGVRDAAAGKYGETVSEISDISEESPAHLCGRHTHARHL